MLVSVIIPCFNVEDYIDECLHSVYSQTYPKIEIICVDNNSTDDTFEILNKHEVQGKIKLHQEFKKGAPSARNLGLKYAKGEWIQFLDADDILLPEKIAHQIELIESNSDIGLISTAAFIREINGAEETRQPLKNVFIGLLKSRFGNTCANLFRRSKLLSINGWDTKLESSQEYDLMFRLIKNECKYIFDNLPLTIIRKRENGQISQSNPSKKWIQYVNLRIEIIDYLCEFEMDYYKKNKKEIEQILFDLLRNLSKYDLIGAIKIYEDYLCDFTPNVSSRTSKNYLRLYYLLGFKKTERIVNWIN